MLKYFFKIILKIFSLIFILALLLSYLAPYFNPDKFFILALLGMLYPVLLIINITLALLWLFIKKRYFVLHLIVILIGWKYFGAFCQFSEKTIKEDKKTNSIKIISYNVRNFDLYNYDKNWNFNTKNRNNIFSFLKEEDPQIICFQEYVETNDKAFATGDTLVKFLQTKYIHTHYTVKSKANNLFGLATLSAYPIINKDKIKFPGKTTNSCIYTDIIVASDTFRIYNVHLESIHFSKDDYIFAQNIVEGLNISQHKHIELRSKKILTRLKRAFAKRAEQVKILSESMSQCPYPIILCGDFNDTPNSYTYKKIGKELKDAFIESGSGLGTTYSGVFPSFRIDYIFHDKIFNSYQFTTFNYEYSDHYPIMCYLNFK